jgi:hypothetical protein
MSEDNAPDVAAAVYDKTGREILVGDVLKVFHFTEARRKRHFMYKQVVDRIAIGRSRKANYLFVSHLAMKERGQKDDGYYLPLNGLVLADYEIVQGLEANWHDGRPRVSALRQHLMEKNDVQG